MFDNRDRGWGREERGRNMAHMGDWHCSGAVKDRDEGLRAVDGDWVMVRTILKKFNRWAGNVSEGRVCSREQGAGQKDIVKHGWAASRVVREMSEIFGARGIDGDQ